MTEYENDWTKQEQREDSGLAFIIVGMAIGFAALIIVFGLIIKTLFF